MIEYLSFLLTAMLTEVAAARVRLARGRAEGTEKASARAAALTSARATLVMNIAADGGEPERLAGLGPTQAVTASVTAGADEKGLSPWTKWLDHLGISEAASSWKTGDPLGFGSSGYTLWSFWGRL